MMNNIIVYVLYRIKFGGKIETTVTAAHRKENWIVLNFPAFFLSNIMTDQKLSRNYDHADESSSFLNVGDAASPSSVSLGQEEAIPTKKHQHARPIAVVAGFCVVAGSMLLVAAGRYSAGAATATATATGSAGSNSIASVVSLQKNNCEKAVGTFQKLSCLSVQFYGPTTDYRTFCVDGAGKTYSKSDGAYESCFALGSPDGNRCWTKYQYISDINYWDSCRPKDTSVDGNPVAWQYARPLPDGSCGGPCDSGFISQLLLVQRVIR